jgi:multiple sugar transport system ATP-binding protein
MAVVETRNLTKYFEDVNAVDRVSIRIEDGEFLVLLGPSGSGKSTLMRLIAGLESASEGEIIVDGRVVNEVPPHARRVAMVFQSYALYPHMTVFDNIAFPLKTERVDKNTIRQKVERAAEMFNIGHLLARKPSQLSGGERQRVALARSVVREPTVFLLDEPLSNLDAPLRVSAREEIKRFQRQLGLTTIYVTHEQSEAMSMGNRVAIMAHGRIRQHGTPQELYRHPADTFVASFLGSPPMNLIELDTCILGFHAENFLPIQTSQPPANALHLPFEVMRIENIAGKRYLYGLVDSAKGRAKVAAVIHATENLTPREGEFYDFIVDRAELSYFDRKTERRIAPVPFTLNGAPI